MQVAVAFPTIPQSPQYQSRHLSPLPAASSSTHGTYPSSSNMQDSQMNETAPVLPAESTDPMYAGLPTYRFPAGPPRGGSAPLSQPSMSNPSVFNLSIKPRLPEAPPAEPSYESRMHFSPTISPVPSLQASSSSSTLPSVASHSLLKPALPIITFPSAPMPEYEVENVYPSGMVAQADQSYRGQPEGLGYHMSPGLDGAQWTPLSPVKMSPAPQQLAPHTPSRFSDYNASHRFNVEYSPANVSPTTYLPSSAYLPSSGTFAGPPLSTANIPRSAPSTPLGRQDARFVGKAGWPSQGLPNMFPTSIPQTEPRMRTDFAPSMQSFYAQPAFTNSSSGYYSADDYERDTSPLYMSMDSSKSTGNGESRYIPYARPTKAASAQGKRSPPRSLELSLSKKAKRAVDSPYVNTAQMSYYSDTNASDSKPKQQRCKIACAACRKTRLKCEWPKP